MSYGGNQNCYGAIGLHIGKSCDYAGMIRPRWRGQEPASNHPKAYGKSPMGPTTSAIGRALAGSPDPEPGAIGSDPNPISCLPGLRAPRIGPYGFLGKTMPDIGERPTYCGPFSRPPSGDGYGSWAPPIRSSLGPMASLWPRRLDDGRGRRPV